MNPLYIYDFQIQSDDMENTYIKMSSNYSARLKRYKAHHLLISVVVTVFLFMNCYVSLQNALVAESRLQIVTGDN